MTECKCGCKALPYHQTRALEAILIHKGWKVEKLNYCGEHRFVVMATKTMVTEAAQRELQSIRGISYDYVIEDDYGDGEVSATCTVRF